MIASIDANPTETERDEFYVYIYLNPLKEMLPFYVGRGKGDRAFHHLRERSARNKHKAATISKIRRETRQDPPVRIFRDQLSHAESCRIEIALIALYGRADLRTGILTNMTGGGDGVPSPSPEVRRRMSMAKTGTIAAIDHDGRRMRVSPDDPRWISGELVGQTKGIPCPEITRRRSSETHRGKKQSATLIQKRAAGLRGRKQSADHIAALSLSRQRKVMVRPMSGGRPFKGNYILESFSA